MTNGLGMNMLLNYVVSLLVYLRKYYFIYQTMLPFCATMHLSYHVFRTVVWFNNAHSSKQKLIDKIDKIISFLAIKNKLNTLEFINHLHVYDIWKIFKLQSVSLMHDGSIGHNNFEFICMILYKNIQDHYTRGSTKVHIITVSSLDTRNFVYHCILN